MMNGFVPAAGPVSKHGDSSTNDPSVKTARSGGFLCRTGVMGVMTEPTQVRVSTDTRSELRLIKAQEDDVHTYDQAVGVALDAYEATNESFIRES